MSSKQHWHDVATRRGEELRTMRAELDAAKALNAELVEALRNVKDWAAIGADSAVGRANNAASDIATADALLARVTG